jgi:hypothetical protein
VTAPVQFPSPGDGRDLGLPLVHRRRDRHRGGHVPPPAGAGARGRGGRRAAGRSGWDEDDRINGVILSSVEDQGTGSSGPTTEGQTYRFRDLDPYDAVMMSAAGVPQPLQVVQAHVIFEGEGSWPTAWTRWWQPDNTVATLMLETGMGTFVRYAGDWQLLQRRQRRLDDMALVRGSPGALASGTRPTRPGRPSRSSTCRWSGTTASRSTPSPAGGRRDGGGRRGQRGLDPADRRVEDLDLGIRYANTHPEARWYVTKRARALAASGPDPGALERGPVAVAPPFSLAGRRWRCSPAGQPAGHIQAAAGLFSDLWRAGRTPPVGMFRPSSRQLVSEGCWTIPTC